MQDIAEPKAAKAVVGNVQEEVQPEDQGRDLSQAQSVDHEPGPSPRLQPVPVEKGILVAPNAGSGAVLAT